MSYAFVAAALSNFIFYRKRKGGGKMAVVEKVEVESYEEVRETALDTESRTEPNYKVENN